MEKHGFEKLGTYEQMLDRRANNLAAPKVDAGRAAKTVKFLIECGVTREQAIEGVHRHYLESLRKRGARHISAKTLAGRLHRVKRRWDAHAGAGKAE